ncbi:MAG: hypothetical protein AAFQ32_06500 [Pseudomonadota bacterium]
MDSCVEDTMILPFALFWLGALVTILMIRHINGFSLKDTVKAAIGMRSYKRTGTITLGQLLTLTVPMGLWLILIQACRA